MRKILLCLALLSMVFLYSCQKEMSNLNDSSESLMAPFPSSNECGTPVSKDLFDMGAIADRGDLQIGNNANDIIVWASASGAPGQPNQVKKMIAVYGSYEHVVNTMNEAVLWTPCMGPVHPDRVKNSTPGLQQDSIHIPNSAFQADGCVWLAVYVTLTDNSGFEWCTYPTPYDDIIVNQSVWKVLVKYCKQTCPPTDCGQLRTQTPGGWGAEPNGNNNGAYLHANFATAFPSGIKVGCAAGSEISLTSAQAITDLLPTGGEAAVLDKDYVNPASMKNVLVGHLVAITLSVGFDGYDANFGAGGQSLGGMYIKSGTFKGKTVSEFLSIANNVIGGCSNAYTPKQLTETATAINENYGDGKVDKGYLSCTPVQ